MKTIEFCRADIIELMAAIIAAGSFASGNIRDDVKSEDVSRLSVKMALEIEREVNKSIAT